MKLRNFFRKLRGVQDAGNEPAAEAPADQPKVQEPARASAPAEKSAPKKAAVIPVRPVQKPEPVSVSPYALKGGAKTQSDWMLLQIGKTGRAFISEAAKHNLTMTAPSASDESFVRHDMTAALLGYRLVLTAYHVHQDIPSLEALRSVRTAMIGMLHRAVDITIDQMGKKELRGQLLRNAEEQFKFAEAEVTKACQQLKSGAAEPFAGFYESLTPVFGKAHEAKQLHARFASILTDLYGRIEAGMAARNHQITG